jgi:hypothetical protein
MPSYEPEVIERFASQLERRAKAVRRGFTLGGSALGAAFGSIPLTPLGRAWPIPHVFGFTTLVAGIAIGALIGWVVGEGRAAMYRLHAQTTLCQLHAQRTTLAIWRLLQERPTESRLPELDANPEPDADVEPDFAPEPDLEPEPILPPAARLAALPQPVLRPVDFAPAALEPLPVSFEQVTAFEPVEVTTPAREHLVPVSVPAYSPSPEPVAPAPPVSPPPLSG